MKYYRLYITEHTTQGPKRYSIDFMTNDSAINYRDKIINEMSDRLSVKNDVDIIEG